MNLRGERPEIRHAEKSDGNPCFGVRGSKGTSTEKQGNCAFLCPQTKSKVFPEIREENKDGKQRLNNISNGNAGYDGCNRGGNISDSAYRRDVPDSASDQYCLLGTDGPWYSLLCAR